MRESGDGDRPETPIEWLRWFLTTDDGPAVYVRDVLVSVSAVLLIGFVLFGVSGIWPPMVAVESPSMEPNLERGDLVFIVDNERFTPDEAPSSGGHSTGVVPADVATETDRTKFGRHGDVIVYMPNGDPTHTPIIHRSMLWVEEGENWHDRADPERIRGADSCEELSDCPAPHAGFITHGDSNPTYDQVGTAQISTVVRPEWIVGTAELKVPYLGYVRLWTAGVIVEPYAVEPATAENVTEQEQEPVPAAA